MVALHTFRSLCLVVSFLCVNLSQLIDTTRYSYHAVFKKTYYTLKNALLQRTEYGYPYF
jgi:hypothetical protein